MATSSKPLSLILLFRQFIRASESGKRLQSNGTRIRKSTIRNYYNVLQLLEEFSAKQEFELRIIPTVKLKKAQFKTEQQYWKSFYNKFTSHLLAEGAHDNYIGSIIKNIRVFFNYLEKEKNISISGLHKNFYVIKTEPAIFTLDAQQLQMLIYDKDFEQKLDTLQQLIKDVFVFGCTTALRFSDVMNLKAGNIVNYNGSNYLRTHSIKTNTFSQIKLPDYAVYIAGKYQGKRRNHLFPQIYLNTFNNHLKEIGKLAGWTHHIEKQQSKRGAATTNKKRFCDIMSSHLMRKTAITNMLVHSVDENIVRQISGHAPGSKEFYRYVAYTQTLIDTKTDTYFNTLSGVKTA